MMMMKMRVIRVIGTLQRGNELMLNAKLISNSKCLSSLLIGGITMPVPLCLLPPYSYKIVQGFLPKRMAPSNACYSARSTQSSLSS